MFNNLCAAELKLCLYVHVVGKGRMRPAHMILVSRGLWSYRLWEGAGGGSTKVLRGPLGNGVCPCSLRSAGLQRLFGEHRAAFALCLTSPLAAMYSR